MGRNLAGIWSMILLLTVVTAPVTASPVAAGRHAHTEFEQAGAREIPTSAPEAADTTRAVGAQRISIAARAADIRSVLLTVAEQVGLGIVIDPDVTGAVTLAVEEIALRDALDAIISPAGYHYHLGERLLRVYGREVQTRLFTLNYITGIRSGITQLSASSGSSGGGSSRTSAVTGSQGGSNAQSSSQVSSEISSDPWAEIIRGLELIVYSGGQGADAAYVEGPERLVVHPPSGVILVTASFAKLNRVADFLERVEGSTHRQVIIEARIVEVSLLKEFSMGIDWSRIPGAGDITSVYGQGEIGVAQRLSPANEVFQIAASYNDFNMLLDAMEEQGKLRMISAPRVATLNNQKAIIKVAREESFFSVRVEYEYQPDGTRMPIRSVDPERITIGLILDVTPQISPDGHIMMHVHPSLTEMIGEDIFPPEATGLEIQANAPILEIREVDAVVEVKNGSLLIIGGLTKEREVKRVRQVPLLGSIPILGYFFKRTDRTTEQVELIILIKPTIVIGEDADRFALSELDRFEVPHGR